MGWFVLMEGLAHVATLCCQPCMSNDHSGWAWASSGTSICPHVQHSAWVVLTMLLPNSGKTKPEQIKLHHFPGRESLTSPQGSFLPPASILPQTSLWFCSHLEVTYLSQSIQREAVLLEVEVLFGCGGMEVELKTTCWCFTFSNSHLALLLPSSSLEKD